jgi:hypothetical protein
MTQTHVRSEKGWHQPPPQETPRLRLKPKGLPTGRVDGAWWPHSADLAAEIPDLVAVLSVRLGQISDVLYKMTEWVRPPVKMQIGGRKVRISGYHRQPNNTIEVLGLGGQRVVLLVVPADTEEHMAHEILMAAAAPDETATIDSLLATAH